MWTQYWSHEKQTRYKLKPNIIISQTHELVQISDVILVFLVEKTLSSFQLCFLRGQAKLLDTHSIFFKQ